MVKRIIILALCFMVYIIINIDTVTAPGNDDAQVCPSNTEGHTFIRGNQFDLLVECYRQMFKNVLIRGITDFQSEKSSTFVSVLVYFYSHYKIENLIISNGNLVPSPLHENFKDDPSFLSFKAQLFDAFMQCGNNDEFQSLIETLRDQILSEKLTDYPLTMFAIGYDPNSNEEWFKTPKGFCNKYSEDPRALEDSFNRLITAMNNGDEQP